MAWKPDMGAPLTKVRPLCPLRPRGPIENSPRREPWEPGASAAFRSPGRGGRGDPDLPLVVGDPVRLEEGDEFLVKGNLAGCWKT